jgi:hypothetical protein
MLLQLEGTAYVRVAPKAPGTFDCDPNSVVTVDTPAVRAAIARRLGREPADRVETFAELRRWKDGFAA